MLLVLSPSKTLDFDTPSTIKAASTPELLKQSEALVKILRKYSEEDISELMDVSAKIAALNVERFKHFSTPFTAANAKHAILAFKGDVYEGLQAEDFNTKDLEFANHHLRILSGLYGLLRPLDLMQPYRSEMGTKLTNPNGKDLYAFWGNSITEHINSILAAEKTDTLFNLASNEYFHAIKPKALKGNIITAHFKDYKQGQYKVVGLLAKRARGVMARYVIKNRLTKIEKLRDFNEEGYSFNASLSSATDLVFTRK